MKLEGVMTALVTPLKDGAPDIESLEKLVEIQIDAGVDALVSVGTTGESSTLSVAEHLDVVRATVRFVNGRIPVIAGAGGNCTREAVELSMASAQLGADALLQVTPYYICPTQEGLYQHFHAIQSATPLPIILYTVPHRTSSDFQVETIARLAELETIVAIKEASGNMHRASEILSVCGESIHLLSGDDFTALSLLSLGGHGTVSVVSNVVPDRVVNMYNSAVSGNWQQAREHHFSFQALAGLLFRESNPIPVKAAMEILGYIGPEIRLPLTPASATTRDLLRQELTRLGLH